VPSGVAPAFDFSKVRRISVAPFEGQGGQAVSDEFVRELVGKGRVVTDVHHPGDVILKGLVTDYKANSALMVFLGNTSLVTPAGRTVTVDDPVLSLSASRVSPEGTVIANPGGQIAAVSARVEVTAHLFAASSGNLLWTGNFSYEALDIPHALEAVVASLTEALERLLAAGKRPT
jgi:TolB-like protein